MEEIQPTADRHSTALAIAGKLVGPAPTKAGTDEQFRKDVLLRAQIVYDAYKIMIGGVKEPK